MFKNVALVGTCSFSRQEPSVTLFAWQSNETIRAAICLSFRMTSRDRGHPPATQEADFRKTETHTMLALAHFGVFSFLNDPFASPTAFLIIGCFVRTRFVEFGCRLCRPVTQN